MTLTVYGKPACPLCNKALAVLEHLRGEFGYDVAYVDITGDPARFARYRDVIPVIALDGREIASGRITIPAVRAALTAAAAPR